MYLDFEVFQGNQGEKCRSFLSILRFFKKVKGVSPWIFENYFLYDFEEIENLKKSVGVYPWKYVKKCKMGSYPRIVYYLYIYIYILIPGSSRYYNIITIYNNIKIKNN